MHHEGRSWHQDDLIRISGSLAQADLQLVRSTLHFDPIRTILCVGVKQDGIDPWRHGRLAWGCDYSLMPLAFHPEGQLLGRDSPRRRTIQAVAGSHLVQVPLALEG
jgi:hypothetical protein